MSFVLATEHVRVWSAACLTDPIYGGLDTDIWTKCRHMWGYSLLFTLVDIKCSFVKKKVNSRVLGEGIGVVAESTPQAVNAHAKIITRVNLIFSIG